MGTITNHSSLVSDGLSNIQTINAKELYLRFFQQKTSTVGINWVFYNQNLNERARIHFSEFTTINL